MTKQDFYDQFISELERSIIIDEKIYNYWLTNYRNLPLSAVQFFYKQLVVLNNHSDTLIAAGIEAEPPLGQQILQKTKTAKKKTFQFLEIESTQDENTDEFLISSLS